MRIYKKVVLHGNPCKTTSKQIPEKKPYLLRGIRHGGFPMSQF